MSLSLNRVPCPSVSLPGLPGAGDACWETAPAFALCEVESGARPFLSTEFRVLRDDGQGALFVLFTGEDDGILSTYRLHDETIYTQDVFELFIAETGSLKTYREIEASPYDVHFTGTITWQKDGSRALNMDWDIPGFVSKTDYFTAEHRVTAVWKLPYAAFSQAPRAGASWRFNAFRVDHSPRGEELQAWQPTGARNFHVPERFGFLDFI